jgi:hypothetical protein
MGARDRERARLLSGEYAQAHGELQSMRRRHQAELAPLKERVWNAAGRHCQWGGLREPPDREGLTLKRDTRPRLVPWNRGSMAAAIERLTRDRELATNLATGALLDPAQRPSSPHVAFRLRRTHGRGRRLFSAAAQWNHR